MNTRHVQGRLFTIVTESDRNYVHIPSREAVALRGHLRRHGIQAPSPRPVSMDVHSLELPADADLKAIQLLIDQWVEAQTGYPEGKQAQTGSRTTLFGQ